MDYGELRLEPEWTGIDPRTGRFLKGHVSANKGKKWSEFMSKRGQRRARKGWKNLDLHRNKNGRADTAGRSRKQVIAVMDDGRWLIFPYIGAAAEWCGGNREKRTSSESSAETLSGNAESRVSSARANIGRCCRQNQNRPILRNPHGKPTGKVNTDHRYMGIRWYFETDSIWTQKISNNSD